LLRITTEAKARDLNGMIELRLNQEAGVAKVHIHDVFYENK
jgi:hypothetical protein